MERTPPKSELAGRAIELVLALQATFVERLQAVAETVGHPGAFEPVSWLRDEGRHGGGCRMVCGDTAVFDRASINFSAVHYDDLPDKRLASANALSCIVHPRNPRAPSMHMHISFTEMRSGKAYWRVMADLNPSIEEPKATARFTAAMERTSGAHFEHARDNGDRYFYVPALGRHRGVSHFYMEGHDSGDFDADLELARGFGEAVIATYGAILDEAFATYPEIAPADAQLQLAYHTLYLFQVLTLDRGTTSGLLVHSQNDVGILGSLPSHINRGLLSSWRDKLPALQQPLLDGLLDALPDAHPCPVTVEAKKALADAVRAHYQAYPDALKLQARGAVVPPTVANHR